MSMVLVLWYLRMADAWAGAEGDRFGTSGLWPRGVGVEREDRPPQVLEVEPTQLDAAETRGVDVDRAPGDRSVAAAPADGRLDDDDPLPRRVDSGRLQLLQVPRRRLLRGEDEVDPVD